MGYFPYSPDSLLASFRSGHITNQLIILTGPRGAGKTTFCLAFAAQARQLGLSVAGIACPALYEGGIKAGIDQVDLASGERRQLGWLSVDGQASTTGCWWFDPHVLAWGNDIISALGEQDLIIFDEIGPLELERGGGYYQALHLLDESRYNRAIVVIRPKLVPDARSRWPAAQILEIELEPR